MRASRVIFSLAISARSFMSLAEPVADYTAAALFIRPTHRQES